MAVSSNASVNPGFNMTSNLPPFFYPSWGLNEAELIKCLSIDRSPPNDGNIYCPSTFDDWLCWNHTLAGTTATQQCPHEFKEGFLEHRNAEKVCMEDGTWYVNPISNKTWTDYSNCADHHGHLILYVSISGNCISCVLLILSLIIFNYYRQLRCARVTLHQHLFLSFILTGIMWIVTYSQGIAKPGIRRKNDVWCKVVHMLTQYASVSNYFWMLCEGFFLHTVVVMAFAKQKKLLIACYILGWGVPLLFTIGYLIAKLFDTANDVMCWYHVSWPIWILSIPIMVSLLVNFILLLNILRILLSKIRAFNSAEHNQNRRAVKATLILVPLLGLQNLLTLVKPPLDKDTNFYWDLVSAILTSFQGAAVSLIFCFFNGEVLTVLKRRWGLLHSHYDPSFPGRPTNYSTTMAMTLDETSTAGDHNSILRNGRKPSGHAAQDSTELQLMVPDKGEKAVIFDA